MTTIAETVAALLDNDGATFTTADGHDLDDLAVQHGAVVAYEGKDHGAGRRYTFPDRSIITVRGDGWDLGYPDCWCWAGDGHYVECDDGLVAGPIQAATHAAARNQIK